MPLDRKDIIMMMNIPENLDHDSLEKIMDLVSEIQNQVFLQEPSNQFLCFLYDFVFETNSAELGAIKDLIYCMFVRAENARANIGNAAHKIRLIIDQSQADEDKRLGYKPMSIIDELNG